MIRASTKLPSGEGGGVRAIFNMLNFGAGILMTFKKGKYCHIDIVKVYARVKVKENNEKNLRLCPRMCHWYTHAAILNRTN